MKKYKCLFCGKEDERDNLIKDGSIHDKDEHSEFYHEDCYEEAEERRSH